MTGRGTVASSLIAVAVSLGIACSPQRGTDSGRAESKPQEPARATPPETNVSVDELIDALADDGTRVGGASWQKASAAMARLRRMETAAYTALIAHRGDQRPTWATWQAQTVEVTTVGDVCLDIVREQVSALFRSKDQSIVDASDAEEWWNARRGRSLGELQIEALEWLIDRERERATPDHEQILRMVQVLQEARRRHGGTE